MTNYLDMSALLKPQADKLVFTCNHANYKWLSIKYINLHGREGPKKVCHTYFTFFIVRIKSSNLLSVMICNFLFGCTYLGDVASVM